MNRGAAFRPGLGESERAALEVERGEPELARELGTGRLPVQPPRDHQMENEEELIVELEDDPLAKPAQATNRFAERGIEGRVEGADEEGMGNPNPIERPPGDAPVETLDVHDDVG